MRRGGVLAVGTESAYALAASVSVESALERVVRIKRRPVGKPLLALIADREQLAPLVRVVPPWAEAVLNTCWPGPLTVIFPAQPTVSPVLTAGAAGTTAGTGAATTEAAAGMTMVPTAADAAAAGTAAATGIGVRQPAPSFLRALLRHTGPLTGTSANRSGAAPCLTAEEVRASLGDDVDVILDTGPAPGGQPSTLLSVVDAPVILRAGPVSAREIQSALSDTGLTVAVRDGE